MKMTFLSFLPFLLLPWTTEKAKQRLKVIDWLRSHNYNISLTARHFGLNRKTVRIWLKKFNQAGMLGLNEKSHRPKNVRKPTIDWRSVSEIVKLRSRFINFFLAIHIKIII